jgi:hypothetical protein
MQSMFNAENVQTITDRINRLTPGSKAMWGKMNVSQMLAHVQVPLRVMKGEAKTKQGIIGWLFGGIAKKQMLNDKPFKQGLPTDPSFVMRDNKDFDTEKRKAIEMLNDIQHAGPASVTQSPHPFFGKMSVEEWDRLAWKHLDHHLRQFGV